MKSAVVCITLNGMRTGRVLVSGLENSILFVPEHILPERFQKEQVISFRSPLRSIMGNLMDEYTQVLFIMATGIVVRLIAPFLVNKRADPAVIVMDEKGGHVISLLSGHLGGANALAVQVASLTGGTAVITTASDVQSKPAIDMLAEEFGCVIENPERVPSFMRAFLDGQPVKIVDTGGIISEKFKEYENVTFGVNTGEIEKTEITETVLVSNRSFSKGCVSDLVLLLRPRNIIAGVGCRRGVTADEIEEALKWACDIAGVSLLSLKSIATVDIKKDEQGIIDCARKYQVPVHLFSIDQINEEAGDLEGEGRAKTLIGANGVCEPCAALGGGRGPLILKKVKYKKRVTIALAMEK